MPRAATKPLRQAFAPRRQEVYHTATSCLSFYPHFCNSSVDKAASCTQRQPLCPHFCMRSAAFVFVWQEQTIVWWEQTIVWWGQTIVWREQTMAR